MNKLIKILIGLLTFLITVAIIYFLYTKYFTKSLPNTIELKDNKVVIVKRDVLSDQEIIDNLGKASLLYAYENYYLLVINDENEEYLKSKNIDYKILPNKNLFNINNIGIYQVKVKPPISSQKIQEIGNNSVVIGLDKNDPNTLLIWVDKNNIDLIKSNSIVETVSDYLLYERLNPEIFNDESSEFIDVELEVLIYNNEFLDSFVESISKIGEIKEISKSNTPLKDDLFIKKITVKIKPYKLQELLSSYSELIYIDK